MRIKLRADRRFAEDDIHWERRLRGRRFPAEPYPTWRLPEETNPLLLVALLIGTVLLLGLAFAVVPPLIH